ALWPTLAGVRGRTQPRWDGRCSPDALQVRPHHVGYPADLGEAPDVVDRGPVLGPRIFERLQRYVQTDLVAMLEAVRHGLGHTIHSQLDSITYHFLHACRVGVAR